ncbi:hypothetical protein [Nostoc sp. FACHB-110]|uniref:hypothetical protein n=1 Tax=Nostoc sp. FACHB-110 TaxID=2692834 RepID=UPI001688CA84|nr:hypothetical protein [Nostoc sp. FACHB-110]MBD2440385.1 hypothetical protein [Nostoc sp. FACHB-110]
MKNYRFMRTITTAIIVALLSLSCDNNVRKTEESRAKASAQSNSQANIIYGDLIIKTESDYLMIPVNVIDKNRAEEGGLNLGSRSSYEKDNGRLNNIIFYRKQDGENHLLLNKKAIINTYEFLESKTADKPPLRYWIYRIIDQDTNQDNKLNSEDAIVGYISDLSGKNFQPITPNKTQMLNWVVIPSQNAIFIKILKDSNNDNKFTAEDQTNFVRVSLDKPNVGNEIISEPLEKQIKSYVEQ